MHRTPFARLTEKLKIAGVVPALLATAICASPAMAAEGADGAFRQVRGWSIYRNDASCSAYMLFENLEMVGFTHDAVARSTRVTFTDARLTKLKDGDSAAIDVLLRYTDGTVESRWENTGFVDSVDDDEVRTLASRWLGPPALEALAKAEYIAFFSGDYEIAAFSLKGTAAALKEVQRCAERQAG